MGTTPTKPEPQPTEDRPQGWPVSEGLPTRNDVLGAFPELLPRPKPKDGDGE
jgi:hypothetical protein